MRIILCLVAILAVSACGGRSSGGRAIVGGPIASACMGGGRDAANPALCSCVQQAANQSLSNADQARAARLFDDPQEAQDIRQSGTPRDEAFWGRYKAFSTAAEAMCQA